MRIDIFVFSSQSPRVRDQVCTSTDTIFFFIVPKRSSAPVFQFDFPIFYVGFSQIIYVHNLQFFRIWLERNSDKKILVDIILHSTLRITLLFEDNANFVLINSVNEI